MDKPINKLNFICKFAQTLGIGSKRINAFCARSGLNPFKVKVKTNARQNLRIKNLFNGVASSIFLRERYQRSYNFLWDNRFYKGYRHRFKLPSRGQRSHTNARTKKRVKIY